MHPRRPVHAGLLVVLDWRVGMTAADNEVKERATRALPTAAAHERSAARHDRNAETLEAQGARRAAAAERRDARLDRDAADAERER
jgi:hypothetical protein